MNAPATAPPAATPHSPRAIRSVWLALTAWFLLMTSAFAIGDMGDDGPWRLIALLALVALAAGLHSGIRGLLHRGHKKWLSVIGIVLILPGVGGLLRLGFGVETTIFTLILWPIVPFLGSLMYAAFFDS